MENAMQNAQTKTVATKEQIAAYVKDMAEIEEREFLLRKAASELSHEAITMIRWADSHVENAQHNFTQYQQRCQLLIKSYAIDFIQNLPKPQPPVPPASYKDFQNTAPQKKPMQINGFLLFVLFSWTSLICGGAIILTFFYLMIAHFLRTDPFSETIHWPSMIIAAIIYLTLSALLCTWINVRQKKNYKKKIKEYENYQKIVKEANEYHEKKKRFESDEQKYITLESVKKQYNEFQSELQTAIAEQPVKHMQADLLQQQAEEFTKKANEIANKKNQLYAFNIIPPDYRTMDTAIMLNSIFRNDLADTMREAILIYDERVFRGDVLRGIHQIYQMLGRLASSMREIEDRLISIQSSVNSILEETRTLSNQLYNIDNSIQSITDTIEHTTKSNTQYQAELLNQTQAIRHSIKAVEHTNQKYGYYMDLHRQGLL